MLSKMQLGGSWRCRKGQELAIASLGCDREFPGRDRARELLRQDTIGFGWFRVATEDFWSRQSSIWFCVATEIPMSRHGSQVLSDKFGS